MTTTGARAAALLQLLVSAGLLPSAKPSPPRLDLLPGEHVEALEALYRQLGGVQSKPILRPGSWDLAVDDGNRTILIELDEELHFNRYRELTLAGPWYARHNWATDYAEQCRRYEPRCLGAGAWGQRWTTTGSEKLFGAAGPSGQIAGAGAPRWKQRALYDTVKDAAAAAGAVFPLVRLSVHDRIDGHTLESWLTNAHDLNPDRVRRLVDTRVSA